jgi:hypothetical protein
MVDAVTTSTKRVLISIAAGIAFSLLAFLLGSTDGSDWRRLPELPGLLVAMFTPGFGVHTNIRAFNGLTIVVNAGVYGLAVYASFPRFQRQRK